MQLYELGEVNDAGVFWPATPSVTKRCKGMAFPRDALAECDKDFVSGFSELQVKEGKDELGGDRVREVVVVEGWSRNWG